MDQVHFRDTNYKEVRTSVLLVGHAGFNWQILADGRELFASILLAVLFLSNECEKLSANVVLVKFRHEFQRRFKFLIARRIVQGSHACTIVVGVKTEYSFSWILLSLPEHSDIFIMLGKRNFIHHD